MICLRLRGTELRLHPLAIIAALLALRLGMARELPAVLAALAAHEGAHLLAARCLGVPVTRLDILPFGGAAQMGNLYALGRGRLAAVALAGPLGNLLLAALAAALAWAGLLPQMAARLLVWTNLTLMSFNLLPALPLDGGRVLYALLEPLAGGRKALTAGVLLGVLLAASLLFCAGVGFFRGGRLNLTLLLSAAFILASAWNERRARRESALSALAGAVRTDPRPHRLRLIALDGRTTLLRAAKTLRSGEENLYVVYDAGRARGVLDQQTLLEKLIRTKNAAEEPVGGASSAARRNAEQSTVAP